MEGDNVLDVQSAQQFATAIRRKIIDEVEKIRVAPPAERIDVLEIIEAVQQTRIGQQIVESDLGRLFIGRATDHPHKGRVEIVSRRIVKKPGGIRRRFFN